MLLKPLHKKKRKRGHSILLFIAGGVIFFCAAFFVWAVTLPLPDFRSFENRQVKNSTQIYDRTGKVLLYDLHRDEKRVVIPISEMGDPIKKATVAVEDANFYEHKGVRPLSILRSVFVNLTTGQFSQGGSTITQQIVKNTLLNQQKTITRKIKEVILALKIEQIMSKDQILEAYLNNASYGGNIYGIEAAAQTYFNKPAKELTIAQAAYLASVPKSPTALSPYGKNLDKLLGRKQYVLDRMKETGVISEAEYTEASSEVITTISSTENKGIKAPHFVFYIQDYLEQKYGEDLIQNNGFRVITTLDYDMQKTAEEIAKKRALENEKKYNAENVGLVAIDPKTGQILMMVGSRDYFDKTIDGAYNIVTAKRQPGSSFKPIVYALGLMKGYTPETILFDTKTEFNAGCNPAGHTEGVVREDDCYMPQNYTGTFSGAVTVRNALAQSLNVPGVKMLYLVGVENAIKLARDMGITTLSKNGDYGLSLVLGGGEVRLLDMASAYGVFATGGIGHPATGILRIEDGKGNILEEYKDEENQILPKRTALEISSILSDNKARTPTFGANSALYIADRQVPVKTGTTNNYRDGWVIGYTPSLVLGGWVGNNDNTPIDKKSSVVVAAPIWKELMLEYLKKYPVETFEDPGFEDGYENLKPILRGIWQGPEGVHDILYYVDKDNPRGDKPLNPYNDPQFSNWESSVRGYYGALVTPIGTPTN